MRPRYVVLSVVVVAFLGGLAIHLQKTSSTIVARRPAAALQGTMTAPTAPPHFEAHPSVDDGEQLDELEIERRVSHRLHQGPLRSDLAEHLVPAISAALEDLVRESQGSVGGLQCRGDGCTVEVTWGSGDKASAQHGALLALGARLNCQPRVGMRSGPDASGHVFLFLDACQSAPPSSGSE